MRGMRRYRLSSASGYRWRLRASRHVIGMPVAVAPTCANVHDLCTLMYDHFFASGHASGAGSCRNTRSVCRSTRSTEDDCKSGSHELTRINM